MFSIFYFYYCPCLMVGASIAPLLKLSDFYRAPLAEFYYLSQTATLYIRWHDNLTAAEVVRRVKAGSALMETSPFARVLNDKRDTSGNWSEALARIRVAAASRGRGPTGYCLYFLARPLKAKLRARNLRGPCNSSSPSRCS